MRRRSMLGAGVALSLVLGVQVVLGAPPAQAATTLTVNTVSDVPANSGACGNSGITTVPSPLSLREATCLANNIGGFVTINLPAGHYTLTSGELQPGKNSGQNITINGAGSAATIIDGNNASRVFNIDMASVGGVSAAFSGVTITGGRDGGYGGAGILDGSLTSPSADVLTVSNSVISNNTAVGTSAPGGGIQMYGGQLTITNSTITGNTANTEGSGVYYQGTGAASPESLTVSNTIFSSNTVANTATNGYSGGALATNGVVSTSYQVSGSTFVNNTANSNGALIGAGAAIYQPSGNLTVTGSTFTGNAVTGGASVGPAVFSASALTMHYNRITANSGSATVYDSSGIADASSNWWGCNTGPGTAGCDSASPSVTVAPRLLLTAQASPSTVIGPNGTSTITAALTTDSLGAAVGGSNLGAFAALPVTFGDPPGDATVTSSPGSHTAPFSNGQASVDYHSNTTVGPDNTTVTFDNATVTAVLQVDQAPAITSANTTHFDIGQFGSFTVTTTGFPAPAIMETGTLPSGLTFTDNGNGTATLKGTPTTGSGGTFTLSVSANNGVSPNAMQTLTVTVGQPPAFTSASTATFRIGTVGTFPVTTSGIPTVSTITESGSLPAGVTFHDNGDGTATIAGTPTGTGGTYPVTLTAANGVTPDATQSLTIQVDEAPSVTADPVDQTVQSGTSVSFSAAASGVPAPTVQWQVSTNGGTSFGNILGANSATYTFAALQSDNGNQYRAVFQNVAGNATTTAATLTVGTAPAFTSADTTRFTVGQAGSFTATTTGVPNATLSHSAAGFPAWLSLTDNGDGTGTLTATPTAADAGSYQFTLMAANGFGTAATQVFTLFVDASPSFTSADHATFVVGSAGDFVITTDPGFPPTTTIAETGALPGGVTFTDHSDGTATLTGTPTAGTNGVYPITLTATAVGGAGDPRTQSFTLTVQGPPTITSADHASFTVGAHGSFTVTTTAGTPAAETLTKSGGLPSGVTFVDNGDGTATLAGTPDAGTGGVYPLTITASNGVAPDATQSFTLTVLEVPLISSANHATFTIGTPGTFTVTTSHAYPAATTLTRTGSLPSGVTFTDNGDGTATLAGAPAAGTNASYSFTVTATNDAGSSQQSFTLTVVKAPQTITVLSTPPSPALVGGSYTVQALSDSDLPVTVTIDAATTASSCSISGVTVSFDSTGTCVLDFDQAGDTTYAAASQVQQTIAVGTVPTTVVVTPSAATTVFGQSVHVTATVSADHVTPNGSVQFAVDGTDLGAPVMAVLGEAVSPDFAPQAGAHVVTATFTPDHPTTFAGSSGSVTVVVDKAATQTAITVHPHTVVAVIAAVAPGEGTPTGVVTFRVDGVTIGTAALVNGTATLPRSVPAGHTRHVAASYPGDDNFTGSSASSSRHDPTITASLTAARPKSRFGWYHSAVTVRFSCATNGAPLVSTCPAAVRLDRDGAAQSVTRTISATDGGMATVVVPGIDIDRTKPAVRVAGVRDGAVYTGSAPSARCVARDALSGLARCTITRHTDGLTTTFVATAVDRANNVSVVRGQYRVLGLYLQGARFRDGAFDVRAGRAYTFVVHSASRPTYYDAAPYPIRPFIRDNAFYAAGPNTWTLGVAMTRSLRSRVYWNIGAKYAGVLHVLRIRVH